MDIDSDVDPIALYVAQGHSQVKIKELAGVDIKTIWNRMQDPEFRRQVNQIRWRMIGESVGQMVAASGEIAAKLLGMARADDTKVALQACKTVLDYMHRGMDILGFADELEEIRAEVRELKENAGNTQQTLGAGRLKTQLRESENGGNGNGHANSA